MHHKKAPEQVILALL